MYFEVTIQASADSVSSPFGMTRAAAGVTLMLSSQHGHLKVLLTPRDRAEIGNWPIQSRQLQQTLDQSHTLAQGKPKQAFQRKAELDGGIAIGG